MFKRIIIASFLTLSLSNCAVVAVGGAAAVVAGTASDSRTLGAQIDDSTNSISISNAISKIEGFSGNANIDVEIFNRQLLLTGQVLNASLVKEIVATAQKNTYISKIHNQLRVGPIASASSQAKDIVIANTIRAKFLADKTVNSSAVNVVVSNGEVFLMGLVSNVEATAAVEIARNVQNVVRVNRVFEIV